MIVKLDYVFRTIEGEEIKDANNVPFTLRKAAIRALMESDGNTAPEVKFNQYELAVRVNNPAPSDFKAEDIVIIKKLIGKHYGPLIVGQAWEILEGKE